MAARALPASVTGPADRAPLAREARDWAGEGAVGMARGSGGGTGWAIAQDAQQIKEIKAIIGICT
jgi:hypothetical protein